MIRAAMPTADQIARAIVAACRETQENPEEMALQQGTLRARHYALHALHRAFPEASRAWLAKAVGCTGDGQRFWNNSVQQKFKMIVGGPLAGKRIAKWWDEAAFERVIAAVRATSPAPDKVSEPEPIMPAMPARVPIKLSAQVGSIVEPTRPAAMPGKRRLEDMLRDAVNNTQRMTPPPEEQP